MMFTQDKIEKVPSLKCDKCGSFRVMMTDDGPECEECSSPAIMNINLSQEVEYLIYQLNSKENK